MARITTSRQLALALGEIARRIQDVHGEIEAQTITYRLLLERLEPTASVGALAGNGQDAVQIVQQVLDSADLDTIFAPYAVEGKDPAIYFHEDFVHAYDTSGSKHRGVHYSPPAVVSYMARSVESILKNEFDCSIASATMLDPCCGAGTFLRYIEHHYPEPARTIGLELSPAACQLARLLLKTSEVVQANALDQLEIGNQRTPLVVIGNPPYSGHSANAGSIAGLMADYRMGLTERNPKWLQDDYVKFIRIAQHWVDQAGQGVVAFITNHSYLTNPTFRRMRESLMGSFDSIYVLDLHGNSKRVERTSAGKEDENIFPIQMGVAIAFMVKTGRRNLSVFQADLYGTRQNKLAALDRLDFASTPWQEIWPSHPFVLFSRHGSERLEEYQQFTSLFDIFAESSVGFVTSRDAFAVAFTRDELLGRIAVLRDSRISPDKVRTCYPVGDLDIESACRELQADPNWRERAVKVLYRPFDRRWAYLSRAVMERPRLPFMENMLQENVALAVGRAGQATGSHEWDVVFCTDCPTDLNLFRRGGAMLFLRWTYSDGKRLSNIKIDSHDHNRLFAYIYAILHCAGYRARYHDLLMIDFPRIPITRDPDAFEALAELGSKLIELHLMRRSLAADTITQHLTPNTMIGGYEMPRKYIQDRRARELTSEETEQVRLIHEAAARTVEIRAAIDDIAQDTLLLERCDGRRASGPQHGHGAKVNELHAEDTLHANHVADSNRAT